MDSRVDVTTFVIEPEEVFAEIDDLNVHKPTLVCAAAFFGSSHQQRSQSRLLMCRINRQKTEIGAFSAEFDINASGDQTVAVGQKELSLLEKILDTLQVDTIRFNEEPLGASKGAIDKRSDLIGVCQQRLTY